MSSIQAVIPLYDVWCGVNDDQFLKEMKVRAHSLKSTISTYSQEDRAHLIRAIDCIFENTGNEMVKIANKNMPLKRI